jgi:hypothetical protein
MTSNLMTDAHDGIKAPKPRSIAKFSVEMHLVNSTTASPEIRKKLKFPKNFAWQGI